jgi:hypothetical protein
MKILHVQTINGIKEKGHIPPNPFISDDY